MLKACVEQAMLVESQYADTWQYAIDVFQQTGTQCT